MFVSTDEIFLSFNAHLQLAHYFHDVFVVYFFLSLNVLGYIKNFLVGVLLRKRLFQV